MMRLAFQWLLSRLNRKPQETAWVAVTQETILLRTTYYPLSSAVLLAARSSGGFCLTDMRRYGPIWDSAEQAVKDRKTLRQLTPSEQYPYGEELN